MRQLWLLPMALALTSCLSDALPVVTSVNTLCVSTSRPHLTDAQKAAFKADQGMWESHVNWLLGFIKVRDAECLPATPG